MAQVTDNRGKMRGGSDAWVKRITLIQAVHKTQNLTGQPGLTREEGLCRTQVIDQRHLFAAQQLLDVNQNQHAVAERTQTGEVLGGHCHGKLR
ncbi:hypothetical protein C7427_10279 [Pantoea ananatis]|nr:hypothetical protein C7427_10279 [Pantoea ananatis]